MKNETRSPRQSTKNITRYAIATATVLLIVLTAMQFSDEVAWDAADFIIVGTLLFGSGLIYEVIARRVHSIAHRRIIALTIAFAVLLIWVELAVGIFD